MPNIGGNSNDLSYRYKMPCLKITVEGKGKNIRTVIVNISLISKALRCLPTHITKYLSKVLCTQSHFDKKRGRSHFKGVHDISVLVDHLNNYITLFILCQNCKLPELNSRNICKACGLHKSSGRKKTYKDKTESKTDTPLDKNARSACMKVFGNIKDEKKLVKFIFDTIFGYPILHDHVISQLDKHSTFLGFIARNIPHVFIACFENVFSSSDSLLLRAAIVFEKLYDSDILSEEHITAWHKCTEYMKLKSNCTLFISWLENAEEDSE